VQDFCSQPLQVLLIRTCHELGDLLVVVNRAEGLTPVDLGTSIKWPQLNGQNEVVAGQINACHEGRRRRSPATGADSEPQQAMTFDDKTVCFWRRINSTPTIRKQARAQRRLSVFSRAQQPTE
jgi:hypothetical protein